MNVISASNKILNSTASIGEIDDFLGLILESRSGTKGSRNERNTDYSLALEVILSRLKELSTSSIKIYIVSSKALKIWKMAERVLVVDNSEAIDIDAYDTVELRKKISKAQQDKKQNSGSKGGNPTKRILIHADISKKQWSFVINGSAEINSISENDISSHSYIFDPNDVDDAQEKILQSIVVRRGQSTFRKKLIKAYEGKCAITNTDITEILEGAHIVPYKGEKTNHITNGLLLRADIHTLFDLGLLGINSKYEVVISSAISNSEYEKYHGNLITLPEKKCDYPSKEALKSRPLPKTE